jgi:AhpD family alkylhydroperoxidase
MVPGEGAAGLSRRLRRVSFLFRPEQERHMARLKDMDADSTEVDVNVLQRVLQRRGGRLLNLDKQLLHSPAVADGWNVFMGAIRGQTVLDGALRELVILLVAVLNRAPYEFAQHAPVAQAQGVSQAQIDAVPDWRESTLFDARESDVLAYAEAMTLAVQVPKELFDAVRRHFSVREMVELTATVASYNMVSRFLEALRIEIEP